MKYGYLLNNSNKIIIEITKDEYDAISDTEKTAPYTSKVYSGELPITETPEDLRSQIQAIVNARIALLGEYNKQEISSVEFTHMIEEVL